MPRPKISKAVTDSFNYILDIELNDNKLNTCPDFFDVELSSEPEPDSSITKCRNLPAALPVSVALRFDTMQEVINFYNVAVNEGYVVTISDDAPKELIIHDDPLELMYLIDWLK